jgi:hypothetical protein
MEGHVTATFSVQYLTLLQVAGTFGDYVTYKCVCVGYLLHKNEGY